MKCIVETGTDVAAVCFFDPAALPRDFDERMKEGALETTEQLAREGRIWCINTGADGGYLFHFYVDEDLPRLIQKHSLEPQDLSRFVVPGGTICACGAEYAARDPWCSGGAGPAGGLSRYPHMGGKFQLPPGEYAFTIWRTEWPDELIEKAIEKAVGRKRAKAQDRLGIATGVLLVGTIIASAVTGILALKAWANGRLNIWFALAAAILLVAWVACIALMRKLKRMDDPRRKEVERDFPSIVVHMKRLDTK